MRYGRENDGEGVSSLPHLCSLV